MLTKLRVANFKRFSDAEIELGKTVVLVGPNNSGKTTALHALALWETGLKKWNEKRGKAVMRNIRVDITVWGASDGKPWECGLKFDYANEESFYCRPLRLGKGNRPKRMPVPQAASEVHVAFLPSMSGLAAVEDRLTPGSISVRIGEGRTAEVLRNLCYDIYARGEGAGSEWPCLVQHVRELFGVALDPPRLMAERGQVTMSYRDDGGVRLDPAKLGRGLQQTLLLLAHLYGNPETVLLIDQPDAHLEILRQRQTYQLITEVAERQSCQLIAASHSEVVLNEAADRDVVVTFVGRPHRIDDRGSQLLKTLKEIGYGQYYQAERTGWVLYLKGRPTSRSCGHWSRSWAIRLRRSSNESLSATSSTSRRRPATASSGCNSPSLTWSAWPPSTASVRRCVATNLSTRRPGGAGRSRTTCVVPKPSSAMRRVRRQRSAPASCSLAPGTRAVGPLCRRR